MTESLTITATEMRSINRTAVLDLLRRESPISRALIARRLNVSLPTVMRIVDELLKEGLVQPLSDTQWSGGRRRTLLEFNSEEHVVIGIDLSGTHMFGAIADFGGNILEEVDFGHRSREGEENYSFLVELIEQLLASPKTAGKKVWGIGVGAASVTLHKEGIVVWSHSLNWRDYPLREKLSVRFSLPVMVDNDVNLAALGELWYGAGQNMHDMVLLVVGTGIGAGIIINGALYRGAHEASGEVGYLLPGREFLNKRYENFGALESQASVTGIIARARYALQGTRSASALEELTLEDFFKAARGGEGWTKPILEETLDYLAMGISSVIAYFDPELIILGGDLIRSADWLLEPVIQRVVGTVPYCPRIVSSGLGSRAVVMGAVTHVLHNSADFYTVTKLS